MSNYTNHLREVIRKSTFKIYGNRPYYADGFIDSYGEFKPLQSHHHVEVALSILKKMHDYKLKLIQIDLESHQRDLHKALRYKNAININDDTVNAFTFTYNRVFKTKHDPDFDFFTKENCDNLINKIQDNIQKTLDKEKAFIESESPVRLFEQANKNKGYDAAEFLIIYYDYIAVENHYLLYYNAKLRQVKEFECYIEKGDDNRDIICHLTQAEINEINDKKRKELTDMAKQFVDVRNQFHCPSGFPRFVYKNWENDCIKLGLDPDRLIEAHKRY
jgi:hypothetical protein